MSAGRSVAPGWATFATRIRQMSELELSELYDRQGEILPEPVAMYGRQLIAAELQERRISDNPPGLAAGDLVRIVLTGPLASIRDDLVTIVLTTGGAPVAIPLDGVDPGAAVVTAVPPAELLPGQTYRARHGEPVTLFVIHTDAGPELVDHGGRQWSPDGAVARFGPLDRLHLVDPVDPYAPDPAGFFYNGPGDPDPVDPPDGSYPVGGRIPAQRRDSEPAR